MKQIWWYLHKEIKFPLAYANEFWNLNQLNEFITVKGEQCMPMLFVLRRGQDNRVCLEILQTTHNAAKRQMFLFLMSPRITMCM